MMRLTKKQVLMLHTQLIESTGGRDGIRDEGLLDSALESPFQFFSGEELYPSIQAKVERLCYGLVKNHAMLDGNKTQAAYARLNSLFGHPNIDNSIKALHQIHLFGILSLSNKRSI